MFDEHQSCYGPQYVSVPSNYGGGQEFCTVISLIRLLGALWAASVLLSSISYAAPTRFSPSGCDFSVVFPEQPNITMMSAEGLTIPEAQLQINGSVLKANCLVGPNLFASDEQLLKSTVLEYLIKNGMQNSEANVTATGFGLVAEGRGFKRIQGNWATYATKWYAAPNSVLTILGASLSAEYPTQEIADLLNSVTTP